MELYGGRMFKVSKSQRTLELDGVDLNRLLDPY